MQAGPCMNRACSPFDFVGLSYVDPLTPLIKQRTCYLVDKKLNVLKLGFQPFASQLRVSKVVPYQNYITRKNNVFEGCG